MFGARPAWLAPAPPNLPLNDRNYPNKKTTAEKQDEKRSTSYLPFYRVKTTPLLISCFSYCLLSQAKMQKMESSDRSTLQSWRSDASSPVSGKPRLQSVGENLSDRNSNISSPRSSVHANLMGSHNQMDPKKYYAVCALLGEGSMVRTRE